MRVNAMAHVHPVSSRRHRAVRSVASIHFTAHLCARDPGIAVARIRDQGLGSEEAESQDHQQCDEPSAHTDPGAEHRDVGEGEDRSATSNVRRH